MVRVVNWPDRFRMKLDIFEGKSTSYHVYIFHRHFYGNDALEKARDFRRRKLYSDTHYYDAILNYFEAIINRYRRLVNDE